jgi:hypothetical protein
MEKRAVVSRMVSLLKIRARTVLINELNIGIYKFYAIDVSTLEDKPGFPVLIDGNFANNDKTR